MHTRKKKKCINAGYVPWGLGTRMEYFQVQWQGSLLRRWSDTLFCSAFLRPDGCGVQQSIGAIFWLVLMKNMTTCSLFLLNQCIHDLIAYIPRKEGLRHPYGETLWVYRRTAGRYRKVVRDRRQIGTVLLAQWQGNLLRRCATRNAFFF